MAHLFWLSDEAWAAVEPHLPKGQPGKPRVDDRVVISGILRVPRLVAAGAMFRPTTGRLVTIPRRSRNSRLDHRLRRFGKSASTAGP